MQIVEMTDMFWDQVNQAARAHEANLLITPYMFPLPGARPMLTAETIALPQAYFLHRRPPDAAWDGVHCEMQCEYVFDDVAAMLKRVLHMYEDAANLMPESSLQCRRRHDLRLALRRYTTSSEMNARTEATF